jgi:hypothetical protein
MAKRHKRRDDRRRTLDGGLLKHYRPFCCGDHDVAVFQAFKEVEVAVRHAANAKGVGYADSEVGTTLMRKAFHPETGPLADKTLVVAERKAEMHLFAAAIGHAKNPTSHRDVAITALEAARLYRVRQSPVRHCRAA